VSAHTPGPWYVAADRNIAGMIRIESHQDGYVADVRGGFADDVPNANLIAAAPTLLAKLKEIHGAIACSCRLEPFVDGPVPCKTCQILAVIQAAEGVQ